MGKSNRKVDRPICGYCGYTFKGYEELLESNYAGQCFCPKCKEDICNDYEAEEKVKRAKMNGYTNKYNRVLRF